MGQFTDVFQTEQQGDWLEKEDAGHGQVCSLSFSMTSTEMASWTPAGAQSQCPGDADQSPGLHWRPRGLRRQGANRGFFWGFGRLAETLELASRRKKEDGFLGEETNLKNKNELEMEKMGTKANTQHGGHRRSWVQGWEPWVHSSPRSPQTLRLWTGRWMTVRNEYSLCTVRTNANKSKRFHPPC